MKYIVLIYNQESFWSNLSPEQQGQMYAEYGSFTEEASKTGIILNGEPLQPVMTATTVRVREGKAVVTDGPFAETKEQLGGYYLLNCNNLDEAIEFAAKIPDARAGSIEIRPIMEIAQPS